MTTLDRIDGIHIPSADAQWGNELNRLRSLGSGLNALYHTIKAYEDNWAAAFPNTVILGAFGGISPIFDFMREQLGTEKAAEFNEPPQWLIESTFHWYTGSLCNYVALVGYLASASGASTESTKDYQTRICGAALTYRNKVSAHFARSAPRAIDNVADLARSTMDFPMFAEGRYRTGTFDLTIGSTTSQHDTSWSLTECHEQLVNRFGEAFQPEIATTPDAVTN